MNGSGLAYDSQETAERMADKWRENYYSLLNAVSQLNNESLDSMKLSSLIASHALDAAQTSPAK